jgi:hypothetical protein
MHRTVQDFSKPPLPKKMSNLSSATSVQNLLVKNDLKKLDKPTGPTIKSIIEASTFQNN